MAGVLEAEEGASQEAEVLAVESFRGEVVVVAADLASKDLGQVAHLRRDDEVCPPEKADSVQPGVFRRLIHVARLSHLS